jgi:hypothetical protein
MHTLKQSLSNLINKEIIVLIHRVHKKFPETSIDGMLDMWCVQQDISFDEIEPLLELELEKTEYTSTTSENAMSPLIQSIIKVVNKEICKFAKKLPHTSEYSVIAIWCEQQNMPLSLFGLDENEPCVQRNICQHIYIKGKNTNTQCKTKIKGDGCYCSKHVQNHTEQDGGENKI